MPDAVNVVLGGGDDARFQSDPGLRARPGGEEQRPAPPSGLHWLLDLSYFGDSGSFLKAVANNWAVSRIASVQSGVPYAELVTNDLNNDGNRANDIVAGSRNTHRLLHPEERRAAAQKRIPWARST